MKIEYFGSRQRCYLEECAADSLRVQNLSSLRLSDVLSELLLLFAKLLCVFRIEDALRGGRQDS